MQGKLTTSEVRLIVCQTINILEREYDVDGLESLGYRTVEEITESIIGDEFPGLVYEADES